MEVHVSHVEETFTASVEDNILAKGENVYTYTYSQTCKFKCMNVSVIHDRTSNQV